MSIELQAWLKLKEISGMSDEDLQDCIAGGSTPHAAMYDLIFQQLKEQNDVQSAG